MSVPPVVPKCKLPATVDSQKENFLAECSATYYKWKAKYGGLEASDVKRMKELEHENSRLKRMYADLSLENQALKDVIAKKL